jgi:DNA polymerase-1
MQLKTKEEGMRNNLTLYTKYWLPFGELLTDMERTGIKVDTAHLKRIQLTAERDKQHFEDSFLQWVYANQNDGTEFNASSSQ